MITKASNGVHYIKKESKKEFAKILLTKIFLHQTFTLYGSRY